MKSSINSLLFNVVILTAVLVCACSSQGKSIKTTDLKGDWTLEMATRDGQETSTLENLFMDFDIEASKVKTNVFGNTDEYDFELNDNVVSIDDGKFEFILESLEDDILVINMNINNTPFKMWFVR
jgi:subtilisin-like proprotein convertase family protein